MVIFKNNVFGSNNLGVYLCANNEYFLHPPKTKKEILKQMREISPEIEPIELTINGGSVLGAYVAINSHGMIVPSIISDTELRKLKKNMNYEC